MSQPAKQKTVTRIPAVAANDNESETPRRRAVDNITRKNVARKLNLDRRVKSSERRVRTDASYQGPSRRMNIDRRHILKDRRDEE